MWRIEIYITKKNDFLMSSFSLNIPNIICLFEHSFLLNSNIILIKVDEISNEANM